MINNYSYLDGLKVIMGNIPINIAALVVLIAYGRPPEYDGDEERKTKADSIFAQLVIGHIFFTIGSYLDLGYYSKFVLFSVILIFYSVLIAIQICHHWYFLPEE